MLHFWDLAAGKHLQRVDLGAEHQIVLELRPAHNPQATWGLVGVVVSTQDLSASVWRWHRAGDSEVDRFEGVRCTRPGHALVLTAIGVTETRQRLRAHGR